MCRRLENKLNTQLRTDGRAGSVALSIRCAATTSLTTIATIATNATTIILHPATPPFQTAAHILLSHPAEQDFHRVEEEFALRAVSAVGARFGFRMDAVVAMIDPAPETLRSLLKRALLAVRGMSALRCSRLAGSALGVSDALPRLEAAEGGASREAELWEGEREWSFVTVAYDEATGERQLVACNERAAELAGAHREELLARFASREMEVPFVEGDWLANLECTPVLFYTSFTPVLHLFHTRGRCRSSRWTGWPTSSTTSSSPRRPATRRSRASSPGGGLIGGQC